tara:strand:- start:334 stop:555 length:222 start_codon:yes stop_codon:yes gene_type:complete
MTYGLVFFLFTFKGAIIKTNNKRKMKRMRIIHNGKDGGFMELIGVIGLIVLYKLLDQPTNITDAYNIHESVEE